MKQPRKETILIVDDQKANIFALEHLLSAKNRQLLTAANGRDALQIALNKNVDLIILDVHMPEMDGFEVAQILRSNRRTENIPVIFATATNKEHKFVLKGYEEGAIDYLYKPLEPEVVKAKVAVLLKLQLQKKELIEKNLILQRAELLINNCADIIAIIDAKTFKVEEVNKAFTTILGYTAEEVMNTHLDYFITNEDRVLLQELKKTEKEKLAFEIRIYCKNRSIKWLQWKVVIKQGKWFVNARDITEVKEVEKVRNQLATVVRQSNDAVYLHDEEGKIISWNVGAEKMYGYSEGEALQMKVWNIIPDYIQAESGEIISSISDGKKVQEVETKRVNRHGQLLDVLFSASIIRDIAYDQKFIAITERDITAQKIADEQLRESEKRFRNLFEKAPYPMWVYDLSTLDFLEVNQTAIANYGYTRDEFLSMKISDIRPKEDVVKLVEDVKQRHQDVQTSNGWKHCLKDGRQIDVQIASHLINYKEHKAALVIAKDITERIQAEEKIRQLNAELKNNLSQLEATNRELESFSYSVSHDLRAPLRALSGYSKMIEEDYADILDNEAKRLLGNIQQNSKRMGTLIDDLLAFSRLGRKEVQKSEINMNKLVQTVLNEINPAPQQATITLHDLYPVYGDPSLLYQVCVNLVSNALKYSAKKEEPQIEIGSMDKNDEIVFYVKDNGAGFDMKYADKLFGVFQRLHNPQEFEGTGIGLAIVQRIVAKHGGKIWAEAKPNEGATFYFSIPQMKMSKP